MQALNPKTLLNYAISLHQSGKVDAALKTYCHLLKQFPKNAHLLYLIGVSHCQKGRKLEGINFFNKSIESNPGDIQRYFDIAIQLQNLNYFKDAIYYYDLAIKVNPSSSEAYNNRGNALQDIGMHEEALVSFDKAIALNSTYIAAIHNKGLALKENKSYDYALRTFEQAININPNDPMLHLDKGYILEKLGKFDKALVSFKRAIELKPDYAEAYSNQCSALVELQRLDEALASAKRAVELKPSLYEAHKSLSLISSKLKKFDEALTSWNNTIELQPNHAEAFNNRCSVLIELGRLDEALASIDCAIELKNDFAEAYDNRGVVLSKLNRFDEALVSFERAIELKPDYAGAYCNRGVTLTKSNQHDEALVSFERAIELKPDYAGAYNNRGVTLTKSNQHDEALVSFERAIELKPDYAEAYYNKGRLFQESLKEYNLASINYDNAIALRPEYIEAKWNKSLLKLLLGDYENGWQLYEHRWETESQKLSNRIYSQPLWLGDEPLANKTILIWAEQGLGDTIQFCRYIKMVSNLGAKVIFDVQEPLLKSLVTLNGVNKTIQIGEKLPNFDFHCPLLSLPLAFKTTIETIPNGIPYLSPDPNKVAYWRQKLEEKSNLRVGLVWSGGFRPDQPEVWSVNKRRNIPLIKLKSLNLPNIDFYSLQKGVEAEEELATLQSSGWNGPNIIDFTKELNDYSDTAALIANLDLVVSVDTSVVHMTGAIGKPIWILNRFDTDWRWFVDRSDSPWYPTATIFNQPSFGDWDAVVEDVRSKLMELVHKS